MSTIISTTRRNNPPSRMNLAHNVHVGPVFTGGAALHTFFRAAKLSVLLVSGAVLQNLAILAGGWRKWYPYGFTTTLHRPATKPRKALIAFSPGGRYTYRRLLSRCSFQKRNWKIFSVITLASCSLVDALMQGSSGKGPMDFPTSLAPRSNWARELLTRSLSGRVKITSK